MTDHAQKRPLSDVENLLDNVKAVLLTVEGTTTPVAFIKETLINYVKDNVKTYVETNFGNEDVQEVVEAFRNQATSDAEVEGVVAVPGKDASQEDVVNAVANSALWMLNSGHKSTPLKQIETMIWGAAFKNGSLHEDFFEDVVPALHELIARNIKVFIYASLGVETIRQLFGFSNSGNISELVSGFFDVSTIGSKVEKESYAKIATDVQFLAENILYLTNLPTEATAANAAGLKTCLVARKENPEVSEDDVVNFSTISSFDELFSDDDLPIKKTREGDYAEDSSDESEEKADGGDADGQDD